MEFDKNKIRFLKINVLSEKFVELLSYIVDNTDKKAIDWCTEKIDNKTIACIAVRDGHFIVCGWMANGEARATEALTLLIKKLASFDIVQTSWQEISTIGINMIVLHMKLKKEDLYNEKNREYNYSKTRF